MASKPPDDHHGAAAQRRRSVLARRAGIAVWDQESAAQTVRHAERGRTEGRPTEALDSTDVLVSRKEKPYE